MTDMPTPPPPKADPETLVLRGRPARVTRFRRGAIVALAASVSVAVVAVAWLALRPASLGLIAPGPERAELAAGAPDALEGVPRTYGDVPRLGPPLPGDLGRPILERQRALGDDPTTPMADAAQRAAQEAEAERQRMASERRAARESGIMVQIAGADVPPATSSSAPPEGLAPPVPAAGATGAADPGREPGGTGLVGRSNSAEAVNPHRLERAVSPYILGAGSVIAASLITGLNSDLPGLVTAQVTENAYDSLTGRILLIPQGSRLIGSYDNVVAYGQSRALVVWQRIVLPDGSSIRIDNVPATDTAGYAGLSDRIERHTWQLLKGVVLSTLLGVGTELSFGSNESDLVEAIRESAQQSGARAGDQLVSRSLGIQPTLQVRPGWPLRIVVHKDLVLAPWRG